jgi:hypothetical protein
VQFPFKAINYKPRGFRWFSDAVKHLANSFAFQNINCSASDRPRKLKLALLEYSDNEDPERVVKIVLPWL